jgi:hypothetical protein
MINDENVDPNIRICINHQSAIHLYKGNNHKTPQLSKLFWMNP